MEERKQQIVTMQSLYEECLISLWRKLSARERHHSVYHSFSKVEHVNNLTGQQDILVQLPHHTTK